MKTCLNYIATPQAAPGWRTHQRQAFRLHQLPAHPRFRPGNRNLAHRRADRTYGRADPATLAAVSTRISDPAAARRQHQNFVSRSQVDPTALALLQYKLPNGQYLFPSANPNFTPTLNFPENVFLTQPAYFISDQAVADLDYLASSKDTLSLKYYYQHDPTTAPFGYSAFRASPIPRRGQPGGFHHQHSIHSPNFSVAEVFGFIREKVYSTIGQPFTRIRGHQ
jgi:hypothetical protein